MAEQQITLTVTPEGIESFCREIIGGSANTGRKHATLIALQGFIARHAGADSHSPACEAILQRIRNFSEQTRSDLLREQTNALQPALEENDVRELGRIHQTLSRNGFSQILSRAWQPIPADRQRRIIDRLQRWCGTAEQAAREASGYPDAMNFHAAGVDLQAYRAVRDILNQLTEGTE